MRQASIQDNTHMHTRKRGLSLSVGPLASVYLNICMRMRVLYVCFSSTHKEQSAAAAKVHDVVVNGCGEVSDIVVVYVFVLPPIMSPHI